jgi:LPXTG-motif cell wall-anchored protein
LFYFERSRFMKYFRKLMVVVGSVVMLMALTASIAFAQDPAAGQSAWEQSSCAKCHGTAGEGMWAGPLAGYDGDAASLISQARSPRRNMPTFNAEKVSDEVLTNMHAYLSSLPVIEGFTPKDAGLAGDAHPGQQLLVQKKCVACHTAEGPFGGFVKRGSAPTIEAVMTQVHTPRQSMPAFSTDQVSDADIAAITEFLVMQYEAATQQTGAEEATATPAAAEATATPVVEEATPTPAPVVEEATPTPAPVVEEATPAPTVEEAAPAPVTLPATGQANTGLSWLILAIGIALLSAGFVLGYRSNLT